jgi:hypothetical protein
METILFKRIQELCGLSEEAIKPKAFLRLPNVRHGDQLPQNENGEYICEIIVGFPDGKQYYEVYHLKSWYVLDRVKKLYKKPMQAYHLLKTLSIDEHPQTSKRLEKAPPKEPPEGLIF